MNKTAIISSALTLILAVSVMSYAQNSGNNNRNSQGAGGFINYSDFSELMQNGEFDAKKFEQRIQGRITGMIKDDLKITDEEWEIIGPRMNKVIDLANKNNARLATFRKMSRRWYSSRGIKLKSDELDDKHPIERASDNLSAIINDETATTEDIRTALKKLRSAKEATKLEIIKAQSELKKLLTIKQEAKLVMYGILD